MSPTGCAEGDPRSAQPARVGPRARRADAPVWKVPLHDGDAALEAELNQIRQVWAEQGTEAALAQLRRLEHAQAGTGAEPPGSPGSPGSPAACRRAAILVLRGQMHEHAGRAADTVVHMSSACRLLGPDGPAPLLLSALGALANALVRVGLVREAFAAAQDLVQCAFDRERHEALPQGLMLMGHFCCLLGDFHGAERYSLESLGAAIQLDRPDVLKACLVNLVYIAGISHDRLQAQGQTEAARAVLDRATRHVRRGEQLEFRPGGLMQTLWRSNRAGWLRRSGELDEAEATYRETYDRATSQGWHDVARHAAHGLGLIAEARQQPAEAVLWMTRCVDVAEGPDVFGVAEAACAWLARAHEEAGHAERAEPFVQRLQDIETRRQAQRQAARERLDGLAWEIDRSLIARTDETLAKAIERPPPGPNC